MASLGQALREEREARNISIEEIASSTKIVGRYLEALETDHLDRMPGGFFVRGIIRSYAKAIGLDPDEVLNRYKEAGLLEPAMPEKRIFPRLVPKPAPKAEASATTATTRPSATTRPAAPAELTNPAGPAEPAAPAPVVPAATGPETAGPIPEAAAEREAAPETAGGPEEVPPAVQITEAPRPWLPDAVRRRVLAWSGRVLAAAVLVAVVLVIWPHKPGETGQAQAPGIKAHQPSAAPTGAVTAPAAQNEPAPTPAAKSAPPAVAARQELIIEISFQAETWIEVRADGAVKITGIFPPGSTARARADARLLIQTGNAGGFTFRLNGRPAKPLGRNGQLLRDIEITLQSLQDFLENPSTGAPTG